jgi:HTH-type transcriptional regulator / antitoxin HigA
MQMQVSLKTAELFLTSKAILIDWLQNLTSRNSGFSSGSSGHILSMKGLMQTRFKKLKVMNIKLIKTDEDYQVALKRLEVIFDAKDGTPASDEADILGLMIDEYEKKYFPIESPDPIEAIKIRMEEMQLKQKDLADALGGRNRVSEVLNRKRKLTVEMIRNLTARLNLSPGLLINDYQLTEQ